ncbi:hypothetical protein GUJ93_ZPchr0012g22111 [Zizania palustris]|uniref:Uncharacterized protein n=1 Tax=Zizania palustris TaxID=103762 RepID=A0A8J5WY13_ZIZPA|nr:hypothetical protein GUJ93_ZPchr0012g22111 [Zizania palustris]
MAGKQMQWPVDGGRWSRGDGWARRWRWGGTSCVWARWAKSMAGRQAKAVADGRRPVGRRRRVGGGGDAWGGDGSGEEVRTREIWGK